ncbi:sodium/proline symporter PutP [Glaciecola sp. XM2]|jgi:sodium/proline symporter|uniref:sodium/proline symporter PutP n=1 Tax=Glaciecola sp. XM2 TaxID=1914931 RepID=UPI001BDDCD7E|nr:sodium/proline symporter PutP [Glaciecola sp. XM2]MBT1449906.1 sodium/proline symporter PutP [Glaciecola sp. XM2]
MEFGTYISLGLYFVAMLGIGLYAYRTNEESASGYLLGGRKLSAPVTALSAGASDMSGWMLMGVPGAMYVSGASSLWIVFGLCIGAWFNYLLIAPRLRVFTEVANDAITLPDFFENRFFDNSHVLRIVASVVIIIFFTIYTSSGVVAGGKLFESSFGLSYHWGVLITAGVVVAYTLVGGFMAVSLTDFIQGCIMFIALILVPTVVIFELGGVNQTLGALSDINPNLLKLFTDAATGEALGIIAIISLMSWGLGYFGQPHIIVRFMAINSVKQIPAARRIGMTWMVVSLFGAAMTGLFGLAYVTQTNAAIEDGETIFIILSQLLFHPLIGGFLLAAILAAIMSTISSQLLVTSSSLTRDIYVSFLHKDASEKHQVLIGRVSVLVVAIVAVLLAFGENKTILSLVSNAWAGFGAAFGPLILFTLFWQGMTQKAAIAGILSGAITVLIWIYAPLGENGASLSATLYEIIPGFIISSIVIMTVGKLTAAENKDITTLFDEYKRQLKNTDFGNE